MTAATLAPPVSGASLAHDLGLQVVDLTRELAASLGSRRRHGVVLTRVEPGSPAASAGIRVGTVVSKVGSRRVKDTGQFLRALVKEGRSERLSLEGEVEERGHVVIDVPAQGGEQ